MQPTNPRNPPTPTTGDPSIPRILAVDDHPANLVALRAILEPLRVEVISVASGEEALIEVLRHDFALILMDVQMPGLDGFATTALIKKRQRSKHVPVIFLTAISREERNVFQGYAHGAVDYLVKPFDPSILRAKVGTFVELWTQKLLINRQQHELLVRERELDAAQNDARFYELADAFPNPLWIVDGDGVVTFTNQAAIDALGGSGRLERVTQLDVMHSDDASRVQGQWRDALATGRGFEWRGRLEMKDRSHRAYLGQARPDSQAVTWIFTAVDVEDRRRADEILSTVPRLVDDLRRPATSLLARVRRVVELPDADRGEELGAILADAAAQVERVDELAASLKNDAS